MGGRLMIHDIEDGVWTPKHVGDCLVEAVKWAQQSGGSIGPRGFGSGMPDLALTSDERMFEEWPSLDAIGDFDPPKKPRKSFAPWKVSQMERVLLWPMTYLKGFEQAQPGAFRIFKVWVHCRISKGVKFDAACDERKWSRATAYRARDKVLSRIAQGLAADGIQRGRH